MPLVSLRSAMHSSRRSPPEEIEAPKRGLFSRRKALIAATALAGGTLVAYTVGRLWARIGKQGLREGKLQGAMELYREGRYEEAVKALTGVFEANPTITEALVLRGTALRLLDRHDEAIADFSRALSITPQDLKLYLYRGESELAMGREGLAYEDFISVVRAAPEDKRLLVAAEAKLRALQR